MGIEVEEQVTRKTDEWKNTQFSFLAKMFLYLGQTSVWFQEVDFRFPASKIFPHINHIVISNTKVQSRHICFQQHCLQLTSFFQSTSTLLERTKELVETEQCMVISNNQRSKVQYCTEIQKSVVIYVAIICSIRNNEYPCNPHAKRRLKCK